ncbi:hypothetical protein [Pedobacter gandavensis]|uniref:hypothetical protein n=1 Tax=Pedobacter gandavensis TaxID=2679963 RepID=UPI00292E55E3|nr:hypothetical protein [Pedobacter gandavensis]
MSAANNAYLFGGTASLPIRIEGEVKLDSYPALFLSEYGDKIKEKFYIDELLVIDDQQGNKAFLGMVKDIPGSLNYRMHATKRQFKQQLVPSDINQPYIVMNDAGLNTLAFTSDVLDYKVQFDVFFAKYSYKSAYYVNTSSYGLEYRKNEGSGYGPWQLVNQGYIPEKEVRNEISNTVYFTDNLGLNGGTTVEFRGITVNEEGEFRTESTVVKLTDKPIQLTYDGDRAQNSCVLANDSNNMDTYWIATRNILANGTTIIYTDANRGGVAPAGFYSNKEFWCKVEGDQGKVIMLGNCSTTGVLPQEFGYELYNSNRVAAEVNLSYALGAVSAFIYQNPSDTKWYKDYTNVSYPIFTNLAEDGFYGLAIRKNTGGGLPTEPNYGSILKVTDGFRGEKYEFPFPINEI